MSVVQTMDCHHGLTLPQSLPGSKATATVFRLPSCHTPAYLDGVAKDEMCHHGITHKHHATNQAKVDEVGAGQGQGASDHTQAGLEVHALQHPPNQQQDVDAIQSVVPGQLVDQVLQHHETQLSAFALSLTRSVMTHMVKLLQRC